MLLAPAALSAAADSGADASVVVRKDSAFVEKHRFLPTAKRIDRRIDRNKFAYKRRGGARHHGLLRHGFRATTPT